MSSDWPSLLVHRPVGNCLRGMCGHAFGIGKQRDLFEPKFNGFIGTYGVAEGEKGGDENVA